MIDKFKDHCIVAYSAFLKDNDNLISCSSGGVATAISKKWIEDGGYVAGVVYSGDYRTAEYLITNKLSDLEKMKGSKYIDVSITNDVICKIKQLLNNDSKILFFGLPCKVAAMKKIKQEFTDKFITCELICHGPTRGEIHTQYIKHLEDKYKSKIVYFSVRSKRKSWTPNYLLAEFENGKRFQREFNKTDYGIGFGIVSLERCYNCHFKGNERTGDIQIGDFWGCENSKIIYNKLGTSCVLIHSSIAINLIEQNPYLYYYEVPFEVVVNGNPRIINSRPKDSRYDVFLSNLQKNGLHCAVISSLSLHDKIKMKIPLWAKRFIRKIKKK